MTTCKGCGVDVTWKEGTVLRGPETFCSEGCAKSVLAARSLARPRDALVYYDKVSAYPRPEPLAEPRVVDRRGGSGSCGPCGADLGVLLMLVAYDPDGKGEDYFCSLDCANRARDPAIRAAAMLDANDDRTKEGAKMSHTSCQRCGAGMTPGCSSFTGFCSRDCAEAQARSDKATRRLDPSTPLSVLRQIVADAPARTTSKGNPSPPTPSQDLARVVFSTDPRVVAHARLKSECMKEVQPERMRPESDIRRLRESVSKLWDLGKNGHEPEVLWYREAQALGERVGKPWHETPQPTLVEALARAQTTPLWPLGFEAMTVQAGETAALTAHPQLVFKGQRLCLGPACVADVLLVVDLKIGNSSCMVSSAPMPGCLFSEKAFPLLLDMPMAQVSQQVRIMVQNLSGGRVTVNAVLLGQVPKERPYTLPHMRGSRYEDPPLVFGGKKGTGDDYAGDGTEPAVTYGSSCEARCRGASSTEYGTRWDGTRWHRHGCPGAKDQGRRS